MSNKKPEDELPDDKLIHNGLDKHPLPFWVWVLFFTTLIALIWGIYTLYGNWMKNNAAKNPFLQVTNREFSLFLWQFPEYMRTNVSGKIGYLPGFQYGERINLEPGMEEHYVVAPPKVLFLYHIWKQYLDQVSLRKVVALEFKQFLKEFPEWSYPDWKGAPLSYQTLVAKLNHLSDHQLLKDLPKEVSQAFIGWKNFYSEGKLIANYHPTLQVIDEFVQKYPNYRQNVWYNFFKNETNFEVPSFLKIAMYNEEEHLMMN